MFACSSSSKRLFTLVSSLAIVGAFVTTAYGARAACPEADPGPLPYRNARTPAAVCTAADITFVETEINKPNTTFLSLQASLNARSAACGACVFSAEADPSWGPFVFVGDEGGAFVNYGSCFEKAPGGTAVCGQSIEKFDLCAQIRCPVDAASCVDSNAANACVNSVAGDPASCGQYNIGSDCPNYDQLAASCGTGLDVIRVMCGGAMPPAPDAGTDAGASSGSSGTTSSGSSGKSSSGSSGDEEEESSSSGGSSGSSGGKKGSSSTSSGATVTETPGSSTVEGCAQGTGSASGSAASGLVVAAAIGLAVSRRRKRA